jgi:phosphoribosylformylglycinamidine synthase
VAVERRGGPAVSTVQGCWVHYVHLGQCDSVKVGSNSVQEKTLLTRLNRKWKKTLSSFSLIQLPVQKSSELQTLQEAKSTMLRHEISRHGVPKLRALHTSVALKTQVQRIERGRAIMVEFSEPFSRWERYTFQRCVYMTG